MKRESTAKQPENHTSERHLHEKDDMQWLNYNSENQTI